jgi:hypothetical protein
MTGDGIITCRESIRNIVIDVKALSTDMKIVTTATNCPREGNASRQHYSTLWNTEMFATAYLASSA